MRPDPGRPMNISALAKDFFELIDARLGPFDRPFQFHVFPFDAGGSLNFITKAVECDVPFVTYVSWDLFGHERQKRGTVGRYELMAVCDDARWCADVLTKVGRLGLIELLEPGDTFDIGAWVGADVLLQGIIFEEALSTELRYSDGAERCGLLLCIGVTRPELEYARTRGVPMLVERLQRAGIYPRTVGTGRKSVDLTS